MHTYATADTFTATVSVTDDVGDGLEHVVEHDHRLPVHGRVPAAGRGLDPSATVVENRMKNGRVIPVKVRIRDLCAGADLHHSERRSDDQGRDLPGTPGVDDPVTEYADAGSSSDGTNLFRLGGDHWIYNLDSKALGFVVGKKLPRGRVRGHGKGDHHHLGRPRAGEVATRS